MTVQASEPMFLRLASLEREFPPGPWRKLLAANAFADPYALLRALQPAKTRADASLLLAAQLAALTAEQDDFDPLYLQAMQPFWFAVATSCLTDWQFWQTPRQPLRRLLHQLLLTGRSYTSSDHPASSQFPPRLQSRLLKLAELALSGAGPDNLLPVLKSIYELLRHVHEQQRHSDHRLVEQDAISRRSLHAEADASRAIRQVVWGQPVPASIVDFLDETWRKYLHLLHLKAGKQHPDWQQAVQDIQLMVWLGTEASPTELSSAVKGELPRLLRRIRQALAQTRSSESSQQFPEAFAALLAARVRNQPDAGLPLGELPDEPDTGLVAASLPAHQLPGHGRPMRLRDGERWQRCRVANHPDRDGYLMLADFAGQRLAALDFASLQQLQQDDRLQAIPDSDPVRLVLPHFPTLLKTLLSTAEASRDQQRERAAKEAALAERVALRQREAERNAEMSKRQQEEASARAEQIAAARAAAQAAARLAEQQAQGREQVLRLRPGAVVELRRPDGQLRPTHLAMIRASDNAYLFVDRQGQKVAEHPVDTLVQLVLSGDLRILEAGTELDNALQNLVSGRRQYLNDEEGT